MSEKLREALDAKGFDGNDIEDILAAVAESGAAPTVGQLSEEQIGQVKKLVKDAVKLAIMRHDLLSNGVVEVVYSEEEIAADTWLAMTGEGTCEGGLLDSLAAVYRALLRSEAAKELDKKQ